MPLRGFHNGWKLNTDQPGPDVASSWHIQQASDMANATSTRRWPGLAMMAMYHIVIFEKTNEVQVVPSGWISGEECMWPPNKVDVVKALKSQEQPGEDWKTHRARVIFTSDDYNEARLKLPEAVLHTDLGTDEEDSPIKPRKAKIVKEHPLPW
ncbi:hypothetical protein CHARACLAT_009371 [Characodon lateralis]|uniref:Uncharacterized protein n=1 Tax=Characodon lateralis TaxID=208331 RepID=A0ABU7D9K4_9TELE|nr:hypothetical protein [Characodon lateralis]